MQLTYQYIAKTNTWRAYFNGIPNWYGEGTTRQEALSDLIEKQHALLKALAKVLKDM